MDFDRTNLVPFGLDIGTVEQLTVLGLSGNDKYSVAAPAGVTDLTGITLAGLDGDDTFNVVPAASIGIAVQGGPPTAVPGDTLNVDLAGTTNPSRSITATGPGDSKTGSWTFDDRQPVSFAGVETLTPEPPVPPEVLVGSNAFAAGADAGGGPLARLFDADQNELASLTAFDAAFTGGVRVAAADFNGDGVADLVVGTGPGIADAGARPRRQDAGRVVRRRPVRGGVHRRGVRRGRGRDRRRPGRPGHHPGRGRRAAGPASSAATTSSRSPTSSGSTTRRSAAGPGRRSGT